MVASSSDLAVGDQVSAERGNTPSLPTMCHETTPGRQTPFVAVGPTRFLQSTPIREPLSTRKLARDSVAAYHTTLHQHS